MDTKAIIFDGEDGMVWYLGYGSNMSSKVLSGRRKVFPKVSIPVVVPGYQLTFDMAGFPYWEPGFGTVQKIQSDRDIEKPSDSNTPLVKEKTQHEDCQAGEPLHCIAHLITEAEMRRIRETEGGNGNPDFGYQEIQVPCKTYSGKEIIGITLIDKDVKVKYYHPSPRYHKIILDGAKEHGLSSEYISRLQLIKPYVASSIGKKIAKYLILSLSAPFVLPFFLIMLASLILKFNVPRPVAVYGNYIQRAMWAAHDRLFAPVFGSGC